ncbi:MAG: hypothetical protein M1829_001821 [Trizodia sp. TS-e1964]|nr:MAG: hypothetical protein M1829_001821 [Trizodia sp. TS-e1964]
MGRHIGQCVSLAGVPEHIHLTVPATSAEATEINQIMLAEAVAIATGAMKERVALSPRPIAWLRPLTSSPSLMLLGTLPPSLRLLAPLALAVLSAARALQVNRPKPTLFAPSVSFRRPPAAPLPFLPLFPPPADSFYLVSGAERLPRCSCAERQYAFARYHEGLLARFQAIYRALRENMARTQMIFTSMGEISGIHHKIAVLYEETDCLDKAFDEE